MSDFPIRSAQLGPFTLYAFGLALALGGMAAFLLLWAEGRRRGLKKGSATGLMALSLALGLAFARLGYALMQPQQVFLDPMEGNYMGLVPLFHLWQGGFSIFGMLLGLAAAGALHARMTGAKTADTLDMMAEPLALFLCVLRFSELLGGAGYGGEVQEPLFQRFPFAVQNSYGEWYLAVFMLEGLLAALILLHLGRTRARPSAPGGRVLRLLALFSASVIFTESLRLDSIPRLESNSFIRLNQLLGLLGLIIAVIVLTRRLLKRRRGATAAALWAMLLLATGAAMAAEFNEKLPVGHTLLYALSFICLLCLGLLILRGERLSQP